MNDMPKRDGISGGPDKARTRVESAGRLMFLLAGGLLLSVLVSCACGPVR